MFVFLDDYKLVMHCYLRQINSEKKNYTRLLSSRIVAEVVVTSICHDRVSHTFLRSHFFSTASSSPFTSHWSNAIVERCSLITIRCDQGSHFIIVDHHFLYHANENILCIRGLSQTIISNISFNKEERDVYIVLIKRG